MSSANVTKLSLMNYWEPKMDPKINGYLICAAGKCEPKQIETSVWFFKLLFGDVINLLCTDYTEESDKCSKLGVTPKRLKSQRRTRSFALPVLSVLESFKEI
ncbi:unnamed protein product [Oppiella nova]|uniref:Uncharacterized protein n=1 Tax=Oppiella nova TaxID=334625 RepID=A0A7R9MM54_9ACAR|nr:unnamed protein product [Oppiella nova]CAG2179533.1 unnamed protein product [Oppiella nova]